RDRQRPLTTLRADWSSLCTPHSQNRPAADREGVVQGLLAQGHDTAAAMAKWVATPPSLCP
ncbi:MAG TPA: hypothetical protein VE029_07350, partial [Rhizobacter sp.]|nr:hypothetical protein [Rhizobacter sp.]